MAGNGWSKTWTFLRRRLARGQFRHHRPALARVLARLLGVRRRARLRGRDARPRPALRARERLRAKAVPQAARDQETWMGLVRGRHEALRQGRRALHPADVLGRARRDAHRRLGRSGIDALVPVPLRDADAAGLGRRLDHAVAVPPADARMHAGRRQGRLPLSEQRTRAHRGECARLRQLPAAATCSATSPSSRTANIFMAKDGVVYTPAPNGTFLNGITRQRIIGLLRDAGVDGGRRLVALSRISRTPTRSSRPATTPR